MASLVTSLGLRLSASALGHQVYLGSNTARRSNNMVVGLTSTTATGYFLHRVDSGRRGTIWTMASAAFAINLGGAQGDVAIQYFYSDTSYDLTSSIDRGIVTAALSPAKSLVEFQQEAAQVGRFRYLQFTLTSTSGAEDPTVQESGATQEITSTVEVAEILVLSTSEGEVGRKVRVRRKDTPTIQLIYSTSVDGVVRYDISGATVRLWLAQSVKQANVVGAAIWGPVVATVDDPALGEASQQLTQEQTTVTEGSYVLQVEMTKGTTVYRHLVPFEVENTFL